MGSKPPNRMMPTYARVVSMVDSGVGFNEIARILNRENVPTSRGGRWYPSTVKAMNESRTAKGMQ